MSGQYQTFEVELTDDQRVLVVSINRPPVNAFVKESYEELCSIMEMVRKSETICSVILRSNGRLFSAGADLNQLKNDSPQKAVFRRAKLREAAHALYTCPVPLITAVNGAAVGAGAIFAACGDIIMASQDAFFSIPEINVGVIGGAKGLSRLLPPQKIRVLALTGARISAQEIFQYGGIEEIVETECLHDKAMEYAQMIANKGYYAVRKWKEALIMTESMDISTGFLIEQGFSQELALIREK